MAAAQQPSQKSVRVTILLTFIIVLQEKINLNVNKWRGGITQIGYVNINVKYIYIQDKLTDGIRGTWTLGTDSLHKKGNYYNTLICTRGGGVEK